MECRSKKEKIVVRYHDEDFGSSWETRQAFQFFYAKSRDLNENFLSWLPEISFGQAVQAIEVANLQRRNTFNRRFSLYSIKYISSRAFNDFLIPSI